MKIKSISVLKHRRDEVWATVRDRLPEIVPLIDDIESVRLQSRQQRPDGAVHLVNIWKARPKLPAIAANYLKPDMLVWTDRAEYRLRTYECFWRIEPHFLAERIQCSGVTRYEPAMGGRGTRVTFEGNLELSLHNLPGVPSILEGALASGIEAFVSALVPRNFRKLTDAIGQFLESPEVSALGKKSKEKRRA
jgi:hypothetical protein